MFKANQRNLLVDEMNDRIKMWTPFCFISAISGLQGQSRQTVNFDFDLMGTYYKIVLGFIGYKWALVMDISLSEAKMLKYQS